MGKYRWRHRLCTVCQRSLAAKGCVSERGADLRALYRPSAGACGAVVMASSSLPPPPNKFQNFRNLEGRLFFKSGNGRKEQIDERAYRYMPRGGDRTRCLLVGPALAGAAPFVTSSNSANAVKAVLCRVFRQPKFDPKPEVWEKLSGLTDLLLPGFCEQIEELSYEEYIASAEPRRRKALGQALELLLRHGWLPAYEWFSSFLKGEKLPYFSVEHGFPSPLEEMVDRLIQGPHDATHLIAGTKLKPLTARLKQVWSWQAPIFYASCSVEYLNLWFNAHYRPGKFGIMCDYSMFDNSHSVHSWAWVEGLYRRLGFFTDPLFGKVMDAWRSPKGRMTGLGWLVEYHAYVMNASGRDDTALANALLNGAVMFISLAGIYCGKETVDLTKEDLLRTMQVARVSVCGDDSLVLVDYLPMPVQVFREALSARLGEFGFDAAGDKMKVSEDPFQMVYLAMRPYPSQGKWFFAKTIARALWKFGWRFDFQSGSQTAWMAGNCVQVLKTQAIVPILSDVAQRYLDLHGAQPISLRPPDPNRPWQWGVETPKYDDAIVQYIARGYGVYECEVRALLARIREIHQFPWVLDHPVLDVMLSSDEL